MNVARSFAAAALLCTGCLDAIAPEVGPPVVGRCQPEDTDEQSSVSFNAEVLPLFLRSSREGGCTCHTNNGIGTELTGLDLSRYDTMLRGGVNSARDIVVPGNPCLSILYLKTSDAPPFGGRMPLSGPPFLSVDERRLIHDWIAEGADDN